MILISLSCVDGGRKRGRFTEGMYDSYQSTVRMGGRKRGRFTD